MSGTRPYMRRSALVAAGSHSSSTRAASRREACVAAPSSLSPPRLGSDPGQTPQRACLYKATEASGGTLLFLVFSFFLTSRRA
jgi:hypothetical protein